MSHLTTVTIGHLAELLDNCADDDGQWNAADVCDALAALIEGARGWAQCPEHGCHSTTHACPWCRP